MKNMHFVFVRTLLQSLGEASPCLATTSSMNAAGKRGKLFNRGNFRTGTTHVIIRGFSAINLVSYLFKAFGATLITGSDTGHSRVI